MRDFAKLKILEVSAVSWQYTVFYLCGVMGLISAIGLEMTGGG